MHNRLLAAFCWFLALAGPAHAGTVRYVGGSDPGTGKWMSGSWSNFVTQLGNLGEGDELRVAGTITRPSGTGDKWATNATANTSIIGGWDGSGSGWSRLDISDADNRSVIDGNLQGNLLMIAATNVMLEGLVLKRGSITGDGLEGANLSIFGNGALVDRCSILDSTISGAPWPSGKGCGIYIAATNVVVRRCIFRENGIGSWYGGQLHVASSEGIRVSECEFTKTNTTTTGYSVYRSGDNQTLTLDNCIIHNERPLYVYGGTLTLLNTSTHETALYVRTRNPAKVFLKNCIMSECGLFVAAATDGGVGTVTIENSLIDRLEEQKSVVNMNVVVDAESLELDGTNPAKFQDAGNGEFAILAGSAAMNLGDNAWLTGTYQGAVLGVPAMQQKDFAGNGRVRHWKVDAGAYEFQPPKGTVVMVK